MKPGTQSFPNCASHVCGIRACRNLKTGFHFGTGIVEIKTTEAKGVKAKKCNAHNATNVAEVKSIEIK
jgi:hypothetical protein